MAKDVASRVSGDEASAQEARERAAARFASIHDRWSALSADGQALEASPPDTLAHETAPVWDGSENAEPGLGGVSATPILGIATSDGSESSARPRFKTLMGVPRTSPDIDALAGMMDLDPDRRRDTVRLERPAPRPPPRLPAPAAEKAPPASSNEPSLAATSWPWERNAPAPRQSPRSVSPQWSALVESSLDVSAEVAALRASNGRRYWFAAAGTVAALAALFAVGAPRERTLALRWVRQEYQARVHPSVGAITDSARALRALASVAAPSHMAELPGAAPLSPVAAAPSAASVLVEGVPVEGVPVEASTRTAAALETALPAAAAAALPAEPSTAPPPAAPLPSHAAPSPRPAARDARNPASNTSKARQQAAAPRKGSQRPAALAANAIKPRTTRQNSPRKDAGGGIIRETPF
jgi:hypothetical protein